MGFTPFTMAKRGRREYHEPLFITVRHSVKPSTILIVDDEADIQEMLNLALNKAGFSPLCANNGREGFVMAVDHQPQLILVDWMMPDMNGIELVRRLRSDKRTAEIPVIMLSAKAETDNKSEGLDIGADDYVTKPFSNKELISRINALLRRSSSQATGKSLSLDSLTLCLESHIVTIDQKIVSLGPTEFRLLQFFMQHPDRVYSRAQLLDQVWGSSVYIDERTVDVHIRRLRKALELDQHHKKIQTVHGVGYRFSDKI